MLLLLFRGQVQASLPRSNDIGRMVLDPTLAESLAFSGTGVTVAPTVAFAGTRTLRTNKGGLGANPMPRRGVVN